MQHVDEFFGDITYMKMPARSRSYWEAKRTFLPTGCIIELFIDAPAPKQPPTILQRDFFTAVEHRFPELSAAAESILFPRLEAWTRQARTRTFAAEFTLVSFSIPCAILDQAEWEMSFESQTDQNHLYTVAFSGMAATQVSIDG